MSVGLELCHMILFPRPSARLCFVSQHNVCYKTLFNWGAFDAHLVQPNSTIPCTCTRGKVASGVCALESSKVMQLLPTPISTHLSACNVEDREGFHSNYSETPLFQTPLGQLKVRILIKGGVLISWVILCTFLCSWDSDHA